jgi:hypothetical protein
MNQIKNELLFINPASIFKLQDLKDAEELLLHQNFIEDVKEKVRVYEFANKYSTQDVDKLASKC